MLRLNCETYTAGDRIHQYLFDHLDLFCFAYSLGWQFCHTERTPCIICCCTGVFKPFMLSCTGFMSWLLLPASVLLYYVLWRLTCRTSLYQMVIICCFWGFVVVRSGEGKPPLEGRNLFHGTPDHLQKLWTFRGWCWIALRQNRQCRWGVGDVFMTPSSRLYNLAWGDKGFFW